MHVFDFLVESASWALGILILTSFLCTIYMYIRAVGRVRKQKASKLDALFLSLTTPGLSKYSIFNDPDNFVTSISTALALEQIGALDDMQRFVNLSLKQYPDTHVALLLAARYYSIIGNSEKATYYLAQASKSSKKPGKLLPQLKPETIQSLLDTPKHSENRITLTAIYTDFYKKPHLFFAASSARVFLFGIACIPILVLISVITNYALGAN